MLDYNQNEEREQVAHTSQEIALLQAKIAEYEKALVKALDYWQEGIKRQIYDYESITGRVFNYPQKFDRDSTIKLLSKFTEWLAENHETCPKAHTSLSESEVEDCYRISLETNDWGDRVEVELNKNFDDYEASNLANSVVSNFLYSVGEVDFDYFLKDTQEEEVSDEN